MACLGLAVYCWDRSDQDKLVANWLGPMVEQLDRLDLVESLWFDRFDVRGPHLSVVLATAGDLQPIAEQVRSSLSGYLARWPSANGLTEHQLRDRHEACRGRQQGPADRLPGFAANNTFEIYEHPEDDFPFGLGRGYSADRPFWAAVDAISRSNIGALKKNTPTPTRDAIRLVAELHKALSSEGRDAEGFWRHHSASLLPGLKRRLDIEELSASSDVSGWIGETNRARFAPIFDGVRRAEVGPRTLAALAPGEDRGGDWHLLREVVHSLTKQLGLPVVLEIPLILFAWSRSLEEAGVSFVAGPEVAP
jgi:Lantibiotic biosynthesis dehydratase C-term